MRPSGGQGGTATAGSVLPATSAHEAERTTRERVARSILEHGPSTAGQLAERLDLTPAAVRRHLGVLEEEGDLVSQEERVYGTRGRGRPAKVFLLTDAGRAHFPSAYDALAIQALRHLQAAGGESAIEQFAEDRVSDVVSTYREIVEGAEADGDVIDPAAALALALNKGGYVATTQPSRSGEQLCQHHCPVAHVAVEFPELCTAETEVFSKLLGVHVQRLATIADGNGICTTHIPDAPVRGAAAEPPVRRRAAGTPGPLPEPEAADVRHASRTTVVSAAAARTTTDATHQEG